MVAWETNINIQKTPKRPPKNLKNLDIVQRFVTLDFLESRISLCFGFPPDAKEQTSIEASGTWRSGRDKDDGRVWDDLPSLRLVLETILLKQIPSVLDFIFVEHVNHPIYFQSLVIFIGFFSTFIFWTSQQHRLRWLAAWPDPGVSAATSISKNTPQDIKEPWTHRIQWDGYIYLHPPWIPKDWSNL